MRLGNVFGKTIDALLPLLLLTNIALMLHFMVIDYPVYLDADAAVKNLLAQEIRETGAYFPPLWNYVNGDLWVFFTHTVIVPLLTVFPNGFALHAASGLLSAVLIFSGTWYVGEVIDMSRRARVAGMAIVAGGISPYMAENLFGQVSYGAIYYQSCFLLFFSWRFLRATRRAGWGWAGAAALLMVLLFWSNPTRALVAYGLPLATAGLALCLADAGASSRARHGLLLGILTAAAAAGVLLHQHYLPAGRQAPLWLSIDAMLANVFLVFKGMLELLGAAPPEGRAVAGLFGAYQALHLLAGLAVLALLPAAAGRTLDARHRGRLVLGVFALLALAISLFAITATNTADTSVAVGPTRYLVPSLLLLLLLLVRQVVDDSALSAPGRLIGAGALLVLATGAPLAYHWDWTRTGAAPEHGQPASRVRLAAFLEAQGLHYGYASYWNAAPLTVLSAQKVKVRQVAFAHGLPTPMRFLSSDRWYLADAWRGETFLLLGPDEGGVLDLAALVGLLGQTTRQLTFEGWTVVAFGANPARRLPGWNLDLETPQTIAIDAASGHAIGHLAGSPAALVAEKGESGPLLFGNSRTLTPGSYRASFAIDSDGAAGAVLGRVDVSTDGARTVLAEREFGAGAGVHDVSLPFTLTRTTEGLEFRVIASGAGRVGVHRIDLRRNGGSR